MFSINETSMTDYSQPFCQTFMTTWFSPDLFHALQIWRQPPVATEDLLVHWKIKDFVENSITNYLVGAHWQFGILDEKIFIIILILTQILRITSSENLFWKFCKVKYNTIQYNTIQYNTCCLGIYICQKKHVVDKIRFVILTNLGDGMN